MSSTSYNEENNLPGSQNLEENIFNEWDLPPKRWIVVTILSAVLAFIFFVLFLVFLFLWIFSSPSPVPPCPACPSLPQGPCPPGLPSDAVVSYQSNSGVCIAAQKNLVTPIVFYNQSNQGVQLWYAAAANICAGSNPCSTPQSMTAATPLLTPGSSFSLSLYQQARIQVYTYTEQGQGNLVPCYVNGVSSGNEFSTQTAAPLNLTVTGNTQGGYTAFIAPVTGSGN